MQGNNHWRCEVGRMFLIWREVIEANTDESEGPVLSDISVIFEMMCDEQISLYMDKA